MENFNKMLNEVLKGASEEKTKAPSAALVELARQNDDVAVALLAKRVLPMATKICSSKSCFQYGEAEVTEAFVHALMYTINHYDSVNFNTKFETVFNTNACSTFAQMHQTANTGKNAQMNRAESLDDVQFAIPDDRKETPEDSVIIQNIIKAVDTSGWEPEGISERRREVEATYYNFNKALSIAYQELSDNSLNLSLDELEARRAQLSKSKEEHDLEYDAQISKLNKKAAIHKKLVKQYIKVTTENIHTLTDEELCTELRLVKSDLTLKIRRIPKSASWVHKELIEQQNNQIKEQAKEVVDKFYIEYRKEGYSKGLIKEYGIIYDKDKLAIVVKDVKSLLTYTDFADVEKYQKQSEKASFQSTIDNLVEKELTAQARNRGIKPSEMKKAYKDGSYTFDLSSIVEKAKSMFLKKHPDTLLEFSMAM